MQFIRKRALSGEMLSGTFLNLGSSVSAEIGARSGFDWVLIDLEHGMGDHESFVHQLQAIGNGTSAPLVRIAWNEAPRFKRVLDAGAVGVMVPYINTADEARRAVAAMRFPPQGGRGVARSTRATAFGQNVEKYLTQANDELLTILQIETEEAVDNAAAIAAVDGADVLFIGPADLSTNLGVSMKFDHPRFRESLARTVKACREAGKVAGILLASPAQIPQAVADGFTFIGVGTEATMMAGEFRKLASAFDGVHKTR